VRCIRQIITSFAVVLLFFCSTPPHAKAHLSGQSPFLKINGIFTEIYPVQASDNTLTFSFPQDIGATAYHVNQPLSFSLEKKSLPFTEDSLSKLQFVWNFGDGTKGSGLTTTHSYKKAGTYTLVIATKTPDSDQEFLLQDTSLQIKPTKDYMIPKPTILINGKKAADFPLQFAEADLRKPVTLTASLPDGAKVRSYSWDLDDGTEISGPTISHLFPSERNVVTPIIRIIDSYGIVVDSTEPIVNKQLKANLLLPLGIGFCILLLLTLITLLILKKRKRR
jgi:hypothetical protein